MKALLFDIDGTILSTGGAGRASFLEAAEKIFGATGHMEKVDFRGKPDSQILAESFQNAGLSMEEIREKTPLFKKEYFAILRKRILKHDCLLMPESVALEALYADRDVILCLLTGNFRDGAYIKKVASNLRSISAWGFRRRRDAAHGDAAIAAEGYWSFNGIDLSFDKTSSIGKRCMI
jgi:phosphoglycolate phosphatase-like HAD superfamily hydrolase